MVADEISSEYPSTSNKIRVIHNGFANDRFCFANENSKLALRLEYGLSPEVLHVLFCANGWERKGLKHSIEMVAEINQILKCHLWVIGWVIKNITRNCVMFLAYRMKSILWVHNKM